MLKLGIFIIICFLLVNSVQARVLLTETDFMDALRKVVDEAEVVVGAQYWPYPTYADMLFYI